MRERLAAPSPDQTAERLGMMSALRWLNVWYRARRRHQKILWRLRRESEQVEERERGALDEQQRRHQQCRVRDDPPAAAAQPEGPLGGRW